ncbi:helix-turn-helix transcriptional regulator [Streptomyces sp. NPDC054784]
MAAHTMSAFGVSPEEEETYRYFLRHPDALLDGPAPVPHVGTDAVPGAVERLVARGLLRRDATARSGYAPEDPETAIARLMDQRMHELHDELRRVTRIRPVIEALRAEMQALPAPRAAGPEASPPRADAATPDTGIPGAGTGAAATPDTTATATATARTGAPRGVERVTEPDRILSRVDDLAFFAREEILSVEPTAAPTAGDLERARARDLRSLRHGVRLRSVVPTAALHHPASVAHLRELAATGVSFRVTPEVAERVLVYDARTAVIPVDTEQPGRGALFAHEPGLVTPIVALFERIWAQAEDLLTALDGHAATRTPEVSERERRVLVSMISVGKDESGARELGISVRTYRRHVADLMHRLGAASRAQAALLAREHGWI